MTREEAKEILTHNWTRVDNPNYSESELDEAFFMAIEALSADAVPQLRQTDTLIIADALRYLAQDTERHELDRTRAEELKGKRMTKTDAIEWLEWLKKYQTREQILQYGASMCKGGAE